MEDESTSQDLLVVENSDQTTVLLVRSHKANFQRNGGESLQSRIQIRTTLGEIRRDSISGDCSPRSIVPNKVYLLNCPKKSQAWRIPAMAPELN